MKFLGNIKKEDYIPIDFIYTRANKANNYTDCMYIVYKNIKTGEKLLKEIEKPQYEFYMTKPEYRCFDTNKHFMHKDMLDKITCRYTDVTNRLAKEAGPMYENYVRKCREEGRYRDTSLIHTKCVNAFCSNYDIESWYRVQYFLEYGCDNPKPITKQFLDIEVDSINIEGFPQPGSCPINAVTLIDQESMTSYTFLLENDKNPQIEEFKNNLSEFRKDLAESFDDVYGKIDYKFLFYKEWDELTLIKDVFKLINTLKRDFLLVWNISFDIPFIIERIKRLGGDPEEIMCHKDFKHKKLYFKKDTENFDIANKGDYLDIASYTVYMCQMISYAGKRKGKELKSHNLNSVGKIEIGDEKIDYSEEADIKTFPYVNYTKFVKYNIKDVLLQLAIDVKTEDIDTLYERAYYNGVNYKKIFKQTQFLLGRVFIEFYKQGFILGNNVNTYIEKSIKKKDDDDKFAGAVVADPKLNECMGVKLLGKRSARVFKLVIDLDFSSMYPNIMISTNNSADTMIAKIIIPIEHEELDSKRHYNTLKDDIPKFDAGHEFIENYLQDNVLEMGKTWFNLPSIKEVTDIVLSSLNVGKTKKIKIPMYIAQTPCDITFEEVQ